MILTSTPIRVRKRDNLLLLSFYSGLKLPTGDTGALKNNSLTLEEELTEDNANGHMDKPIISAHQDLAAAGGGRVLTNGSGSYDYIFGSSQLAHFSSYLISTSIQYTIRTAGDFNYRFNNYLIWSAGGGRFLFLSNEFPLALAGIFSGEHKDKDRLNGVKADSSQISNLYLGPQILFSFNKIFATELSLD